MTFISNPEEWLDLKIGSSIERASWFFVSNPEERLGGFKDRNFDSKGLKRGIQNFESQILMKLDMGRRRISIVSIFAANKRMFGRGGCRRNELPLIVAFWCMQVVMFHASWISVLGDFSVAEKGAKESNGFLVRGAWWLVQCNWV